MTSLGCKDRVDQELSVPQAPHTALTEPVGASELSLSAFIAGSLKLTIVRGIYTTDIGKHLYGIPLVSRWWAR